MGIKNFSKAFNAVRIIKHKDMKNKTIAIDAMTELYRAALGAKNTNILTDVNGQPTLHISVVLANILAFKKNNVSQIWVFDHDQDPYSDFHNPMKIGELLKRKKRKETALDKIKSLKDVIDDKPLFSDDEEDDVSKSADTKSTADTTKSETTKSTTDTTKSDTTKSADATKSATADKIASLEKQAFSVSTDMINDVKLILNFFKIKYIEAPKGFEGEAIASYLNSIGHADAVYSADTDPIAYGAKTLWRRNPRDKEIYEYTLDNILEQIAAANDEIENPTVKDFLIAAVALGTDACDKTPGIGAKTVIKKINSIKLNSKQENAIKEFNKRPEYDMLIHHNKDTIPFENCDIDGLINWLVNEKSFNRTRVSAQINKSLLFKESDKNNKKKTSSDNDKPSSGNDKPSKSNKHSSGNDKPSKSNKPNSGNDKPSKSNKPSSGNDKPSKSNKPNKIMYTIIRPT